MINHKEHIIPISSPVKVALDKLSDISNKLHQTLFVVDDLENLVGSLTDGDIRRGMINGFTIKDSLSSFINSTCKYVVRGKDTGTSLEKLREHQIYLIPVVSLNGKLERILDLTKQRAMLPIDAVIMAGGKGTRLRPLTNNIPKPLLKVADKPIMEYNVDRLAMYGVNHLHISIKYLGEQIKDYFGDGSQKGMDIGYVSEKEPLGTIAALKKIPQIYNDTVLVMNSDLLTNIDFEAFYERFKECDADIAIASIPYDVPVPYAVLETKEDGTVISFEEKPTYTYYSNGGIYLMKKSCISYIPEDTFFNATDLMERLLQEGKKVVSYPLRDYWLDIGKHADYKRAQEEVEHIRF